MPPLQKLPKQPQSPSVSPRNPAQGLISRPRQSPRPLRLRRLALASERHKKRTNLPQSSLPPVSGSFNPLSRVLFIFPSRYYFAMGHSVYLALEGIYLPLGAAIPNNTTLGFPRFDAPLGRTGLSPSRAPCSNGLGPSGARAPEPQTTTHSSLLEGVISILGWSRFTRSYWGNPG